MCASVVSVCTCDSYFGGAVARPLYVDLTKAVSVYVSGMLSDSYGCTDAGFGLALVTEPLFVGFLVAWSANLVYDFSVISWGRGGC